VAREKGKIWKKRTDIPVGKNWGAGKGVPDPEQGGRDSTIAVKIEFPQDVSKARGMWLVSFRKNKQESSVINDLLRIVVEGCSNYHLLEKEMLYFVKGGKARSLPFIAEGGKASGAREMLILKRTRPWFEG